MNDKVSLHTIAALNAYEADKELERFGLSDMKKAVMAAAGFTPDNMAGILQAATGALVDALGATRTQQGDDGDAVAVPDHAMRVRAATELASLVSSVAGLRSDPRDKAQGEGQVVVVAPFMSATSPDGPALQAPEEEPDASIPNDSDNADVAGE